MTCDKFNFFILTNYYIIEAASVGSTCINEEVSGSESGYDEVTLLLLLDDADFCCFLNGLGYKIFFTLFNDALTNVRKR